MNEDNTNWEDNRSMMFPPSKGLTRALLPILAAAGTAFAVVGFGASASFAASAPSIALSNSYDSNTWRQEMQSNFTTAAKAALSAGKISKYTVVDANNSATTQVSQIKTLILQGYKVIAIDAASSTALNGVIAQACSAGVKVISFDTLVTAPCAYKILTPYAASGTVSAEVALKTIKYAGNALIVRGLQGSPIDQEIYSGEAKVLKQHPKVKVIGTVYGSWSNPASQQAVSGILPSLSNVDVVLNQGDEGYGIVKAFQNAGKKVPSIMFGNTGEELRLWQQLRKSNPKYVTTSIDSSPGMSSIALWTGVLVASGTKVPKQMTVPMIQITTKTLNAWAKAVPANGIATKVYGLASTQKVIRANKQGKVADFDTSGPSKK